MQRNTLLTLCAITALGATTALGIVKATPVEPASATTLACDTRTWNSTSSTDFSVAANWNPTNVPDTANEKAVIPDLSGSLVVPTMTTRVTVGAVEIQNGGTLNTGAYNLTITASGGCDGILTIANGGILDIQASGKVSLASVVTHAIGGDILLSGSASTLKASGAATLGLNGTDKGSVIGQDARAVIDIAGVTFTNNIIVKGQMTVQEISGTATFKNGSTGIVRADVAGVLLLDAGLALDDDSGASWEAKADGGAVLQFKEAATSLLGDFVLDDCATFDVDANITTSGNLTDMNGSAYSGTVDASASGVCFTYGSPPTSICNSTTSGDC